MAIRMVPKLGTHIMKKSRVWYEIPTHPPKMMELQANGVRMVFLGPPGVGKGTYASRLANLINVPYIAIGDLVRHEISQKTAMAQYLEKIIASGKLLHDEIILDLLSKRLHMNTCQGKLSFILDGFPRTLSQAKIMDEVATLDLVVNLKLREDVLVEKCVGRRTCSHCGGDFNISDVNVDGICMPAFMPPPSCASKLITRVDDVEEVVRTRLQIFHKENQPIEEFYRSRGLLFDFDDAGRLSEKWPQFLSRLQLKNKRIFCQDI